MSEERSEAAAYQALDAQLTNALAESASVARSRRTRRGNEGAGEPEQPEV